LKIGAKDGGNHRGFVGLTWYVTVPRQREPFINAKTETFLAQATPTPTLLWKQRRHSLRQNCETHGDAKP
jgi:hypothetical protein